MRPTHAHETWRILCVYDSMREIKFCIQIQSTLHGSLTRFFVTCGVCKCERSACLSSFFVFVFTVVSVSGTLCYSTYTFIYSDSARFRAQALWISSLWMWLCIGALVLVRISVSAHRRPNTIQHSHFSSSFRFFSLFVLLLYRRNTYFIYFPHAIGLKHTFCNL